MKALALAKSRLKDAVGDVEQLALAFCVDTVAAASGSPLVDGVVVVTEDGVVRSAISGLRGVRVVPDPGDGLNGAITAGARAASGAVAVLLGDLPALTSDELSRALTLAAEHPLSMVPDHSGAGTTLLAAWTADALVPRFGDGSRRHHETAGHIVLGVGDSSSLRRDVDTAADLAVALRIGVGAATARAVAESFA